MRCARWKTNEGVERLLNGIIGYFRKPVCVCVWREEKQEGGKKVEEVRLGKGKEGRIGKEEEVKEKRNRT